MLKAKNEFVKFFENDSPLRNRSNLFVVVGADGFAVAALHIVGFHRLGVRHGHPAARRLTSPGRASPPASGWVLHPVGRVNPGRRGGDFSCRRTRVSRAAAIHGPDLLSAKKLDFFLYRTQFILFFRKGLFISFVLLSSV